MGLRRSGRYLRCFYCGKRTDLRNDGSLRQFACGNCAATNYLDENGEITDPPAMSETTTTDPLLESTSSSSQTVFCKTCLKNQHLFVASLAQYFPDNPDDPETPQLERAYYRFRQKLEQRYPQVCAQCAPKVQAALQQASYTAKTDHLRRMVERSRKVQQQQTAVATSGLLEKTHWFGQTAWRMAFVLQAIWQGLAMMETTGGSEEDIPLGEIRKSTTTTISNHFFDVLVANQYHFPTLCVAATLASCWWNPYFVQTARGFTKPLLGLSTWYAYQIALVAVRVALKGVVVVDGSGRPGEREKALGLHAFAGLFSLYVAWKAPRCVRKDMRPLFGKLPSDDQWLVAQEREDQGQNYDQDGGDLSAVLDEISATPTRPQAVDDVTEGWDGWSPQVRAGGSSSHRASTSSYGSYEDPDILPAFRYDSQSTIRNNINNNITPTQHHRRKASDLAFATLQIGDAPSSSQTMTPHYDEEMDWTPTQTVPLQSQHRAFRHDAMNHPSAGAGLDSFNQIPVEADRGHFWYRVPPAPTSLAQRAHRPTPRVVNEFARSAGRDDVQSENRSLFSRRQQPGSARPLPIQDPSQQSALPPKTDVEFAEPSFFAENVRRRRRRRQDSSSNEDAESAVLSNMFQQSVSLDNPEYPQRRDVSSMTTRASSSSSSSTIQRIFPLLAVVLSVGIVASLRGMLDMLDLPFVAELLPYAAVLEPAAVGLCAVLAASLTSDAVARWRDAALQQQPSSAPLIGLLLGLASMAMAVWMGSAMWGGEGSQEDQDANALSQEPQEIWKTWQLALLHLTVAVQTLWAMATD